MTLLRTSPSPRGRWLWPFVFLFLFGWLPFGTAIAQAPDVAKVGARLREAVQAGELSAEQARAMLAVLQQKDGERSGQRAIDMEAVHARLRRAVEAGELTKEQAMQKLAELKQRAAGAAQRGHEAAMQRLREAVQAGKITAEEARKKLQALRARMQGGPEQAAPGQQPAERPGFDLERVKQRLMQAVKSGGMTKEQAMQKLEQLEQRAAGAAQRGHEAATQRLREAVKAGKITAEQAREKLRALRARMQGASEHAAPGQQPAEHPGFDLERAKQRLMQAVKSGGMTKEQAMRKLEQLKQRAAGAAQRGQEAATQRLREAVKAGKITAEKAREKLQALRSKLQGEPKTPEKEAAPQPRGR